MTKFRISNLLVVLFASLFLISCNKGKDVSPTTGWNYNDPENGGFYVTDSPDQIVGPGLVAIEGGTFTMGSTAENIYYEWNNSPRQVTVTSFFMDQTEVSNLDYLENRNSQIVKVSLAKDGKPYKTSAVLTEDEMQKYLKYSKLISQGCIDEIREGYCTPSPYDGACDYCQYAGMCGFSSNEGGEFRKVSKVDKSTIVEAVLESEKLGNKAEN